MSANKIANRGELTSALKRLDQLRDAQHLSEAGSELYHIADLIYDYDGKRWDSYFKEVDSVLDDFMSDREDIIEKKE